MSWPACLPVECRRWIAAAFAWTLLASTGVAAPPPGPAGNSPAMLVARLDPIWTSPLTQDQAKPPSWPTGFHAGPWAETPDGSLTMLGSIDAPGHMERLLLRDAQRTRPEAATPFTLPSSDLPGLQRQPGLLWSHAPSLDRGVSGIAVDKDGAIWLGGSMNYFMDIASARHADAYLAKRDAAGRTIWEKAYSNGRELSITSIAPTTAGGAVVAGHTWLMSWLARIGPDGTRLEEWDLGNRSGLALAPLQDGRTLIAGLVVGGTAADVRLDWNAKVAAFKAGTYRDDVVIWTLGETGPLQGPVAVREAISIGDDGPGGGGGYVKVAAAGTAAYVASNWLGTMRSAGVEVARIGSDGAVTWQRSLPETVKPTGEKRSRSCVPSIAALSNGDALVACALDGQVQIHHLDARTGERTFTSLAPPACQKGSYGASVSLIVGPDDSVFAWGSGFADEGDQGCTWMARVTFGAG